MISISCDEHGAELQIEGLQSEIGGLHNLLGQPLYLHEVDFHVDPHTGRQIAKYIFRLEREIPWYKELRNTLEREEFGR